MSGLYIHIPFCKSRCTYCGFYSTTHSNLQNRYIECACREMELRKDYIRNIQTIYIGGGTPSLLSKENLERLFYHIDKVYHPNLEDPAHEVTIECNPDDINKEFAASLNQLHINRVSIGVQTFSDQRLKFLNRRHSSEQVYTAIRLLKEAGITNISIDLIFGFPNETLEELNDDISKALQLDIQHISTYSLTYEAGTYLEHLLKMGKFQEIDEEISRAMYETIIDRLTHNGFEHYEISNFARPGFRSLHNSSYWTEIPYIGIGAAAHSYNGVSRQWNISDVYKYMQGIAHGSSPFNIEFLDEKTKYNDLVITSLRTKEGIDLKKLTSPYQDYMMRHANRHIDRGLLKLEYPHLRLTRAGLFISDSIMEDLIKI